MRLTLLNIGLTATALLAAPAASQGQSLFGNSTPRSSLTSPGTRSFSGGQFGSAARSGLTSGNVSAPAIQQPGQGPATFVGSDTSDLRDFMSVLQSGRSGQAGNRGQNLRGGTGSGLRNNMQGGANQPGNRGGTAGRSRMDVRNGLRVGFTPPRHERLDLAQTLTKRFGGSTRIRFLQPADVVLEGSTVVLRGGVATEYDRALAEQLARLEPGVWRVRNELVVAGQTGDSQPGTPAPPPAESGDNPFVPE
jgi:osmotically-inducible protein OsmY